MTRYTNIADIRKAHADAGYFWFSPKTIEFFDGRVESRIYDDGQGGRLWVDSIQDHGRGYVVPREFKIAKFDIATCEIDRPTYSSFSTLEAALEVMITEFVHATDKPAEDVEPWHGKATSNG